MAQKILFITTQNEIAQKLEKENLPGIWIDIAKSKASAMHHLRSTPCEYSVIVIDEKLPDTTPDAMLAWIHAKHPRVPVIGISYHIGVWPDMPGEFRHIPKYLNPTSRIPAWPKEQLLETFRTFGLAIKS